MDRIVHTGAARPGRPRDLFLAAVVSWARSLDAADGVEREDADEHRDGLRKLRDFLRRTREDGIKVDLPSLTLDVSIHQGI